MNITSQFQPALSDIDKTFLGHFAKLQNGQIVNQWTIDETHYSLVHDIDTKKYFIFKWGDNYANVKFDVSAVSISLQTLLQLTGIKVAQTLEGVCHSLKLVTLNNKKGNFAALTGADTLKLLQGMNAQLGRRGRKQVTNIFVIVLKKGEILSDDQKKIIMANVSGSVFNWADFQDMRKKMAKKRTPKLQGNK